MIGDTYTVVHDRLEATVHARAISPDQESSWSTEDGPSDMRSLAFLLDLVRRGWTVTLRHAEEEDVD